MPIRVVFFRTGPPGTQVVFNLRAPAPAGAGEGGGGGGSTGGLVEKTNTSTSTLPGALGGVLGRALGGDCRCTAAPATELIVRRYPTTREDLISKERRYAAVR